MFSPIHLPDIAGVDIPADAALAVVTSALNGTSDIQTPRDLQRLGARMFVVVGMAHLVLASLSVFDRAIESRVAPLFRSYGMECVAEILDTVSLNWLFHVEHKECQHYVVKEYHISSLNYFHLR